MKISFDIWDAEELEIISAAATKLVKRRVERIEAMQAPSSEAVAEAIESVPAARPVGKASELAAPYGTPAPVESTYTLNVAQSTDTLTPASAPAEVSAPDAVAAVTRATKRGMPMPAIVEYVSKAGKKVPEMTPAERAAFVAWLDAWKPLGYTD